VVTEPAARRPWGTLNRDQIVATAVEIARREGIGALSIRRLATEVGASRMALYRHIPDKQALLDLVANAVAERYLATENALTGPWPQRLQNLAYGIRRQLLAYPGLADLIIRRANDTPSGLRLAETILDTIAAAGLDDRGTAHYYLIFVDLVIGRAHREVHTDPTNPRRNESLLTTAAARPDLPRLRALTPYLRDATPEAIFDTEIGMLIEAIRRAATG
jgi:AcrR family transcriptional regulator